MGFPERADYNRSGMTVRLPGPVRSLMAKRLHIDCFSGISGDMMLGALLDLGVPEDVVQEPLQSLGLEGKLVVQKIKKNGFASTKIAVETVPQQKHRHLRHIVEILEKGRMTSGARSLATSMFRKLAEAEAASHGSTIEKVHFHEVGAIDSIFDFVGIAVGIDYLQPAHVSARSTPVGRGWVRCEHGELPIPAPAVAQLLQGIPLAPSKVDGELTTPTGAAVLKQIVQEFTDDVDMTIERVGLGAGSRDYPDHPNLLRLFLGESSPSVDAKDVVWQIDVNLDDVPGETIGYCVERLFASGALDVFTQSIQMKKNRPGALLSILCDESSRSALEQILFEETSTFGVRRHRVERTTLERKPITVETAYGPVQGKLGWSDQIEVFSPEYEACARLAREKKVALRLVHDAARLAFAKGKGSRD